MAKQAIKPKDFNGQLAARRAAAAEFRRLPDPDFKYGLAVSFDPSRILLPYKAGKSIVAKPKIRVEGAAEILPLSIATTNKFADKAPGSNRVWSWFDSRPWGGLCIRVPAGAKATVNLDFDETERSSTHRTVVLAEKGGEVTIIERVSGRSGASRRVRTASVDIFGGQASAVKYIRMQELPTFVDEFFRCRAALDTSARLEIFEGVFGGGFCQSNKNILLSGESSSAVGRCVFFAGAKQSFDISETVSHDADRTSCDLVERGVVTADGHAALRPLISIPKGPSGCSGRQKSDIIILGGRAEADAAPHLEIASGDASCSHSAAIGRLNTEQLFQLRGKGIGPEDAARLLISGFFEPVMVTARQAGIEGAAERLIAGKIA